MKSVFRVVAITALLAAILVAFQGMAVPKRTTRPMKAIQAEIRKKMNAIPGATIAIDQAEES